MSGITKGNKMRFKNMNKKLNLVLSKMILEHHQLQYGYSSSAKNFSDKLIRGGVKIPTQLYVQYKLPNNISPKEYEKLVDTIGFYTSFDKDYFGMRTLDDNERTELTEHILGQKQKYQDMLHDEVKKLKALNPELSEIQTESNSAMSNLLSGAVYGFAPKDINYFIYQYRGVDADIHNFNNSLHSILGFSPEFILSPEHREIVLSAAKEWQIQKIAENSSIRI